ncbi:tetratricopeptide repeat protein [Sungkyunkwania multivorans]|uniref:Tetratricopeptide repeat protein n=1 Tax=Sungkyunkwania multivorans TaxID=1173618 RepID=A0ABW3CV53_9FLAO
MTQEEKYLLFEDYLAGDLSKEAAVDFEAQLSADSELANELEAYKNISKFLESEFSEEKKAFTTNLEAISNEHFNKKEEKRETKVIRFRPWQYAAAASIVILIGVYVFSFSGTPAYQDYAIYETVSLVERGEGEELLLKAQNAYNSKNFQEAEALFKEVLKTGADNAEVQFYLGRSLLEVNKFKEADAVFETLSKGNSAYKYEARWYQALGKLKNLDYKGCEEILKTIPKEAGMYRQARKLLRKL